MRQLAVTPVISGLFVLSKYLTGGTFSHIEPLIRRDTNRWEIHGHVTFINAGSVVRCCFLVYLTLCPHYTFTAGASPRVSCCLLEQLDIDFLAWGPWRYSCWQTGDGYTSTDVSPSRSAENQIKKQKNTCLTDREKKHLMQSTHLDWLLNVQLLPKSFNYVSMETMERNVCMFTT